jgi:sarcosine oxidase, subunit gamma
MGLNKMMNTSQKILITDVSTQPKFGVKGKQASDWLQKQGIDAPTSPNHWVSTKSGCLVMRLGSSEFFVEDSFDGKSVSMLCEAINTKSANVYFVPHADASFTLSGEGVLSLLTQVCMLDVPHELQQNQLIMTQVAGVSAVLLKQSTNGVDIYRLWCDGSYQRYMFDTLTHLANNVDSTQLV